MICTMLHCVRPDSLDIWRVNDVLVYGLPGLEPTSSPTVVKTYISQGGVATQLRCGGIFDNRVIANLPQNVLVIFFLKIG